MASPRAPDSGRHLPLDPNVGAHRLGLVLVALALSSALLLGGGTRAGFLADVVTQVLAIPALVWAVWRIKETKLVLASRVALALAVAIVLVPLLQLLPSSGLSRLSGPAATAARDIQALVGAQSATLTVSPHATLLAAVGGLPALAILFGVAVLPHSARRVLLGIVLGIGCVAVFLGLLQVAQGPASPLRFFAFTNHSEAVGFFANRNHFSALLYVLLLFVAVGTGNSVQRFSEAPAKRRWDARLILPVLIGATLLLITVATQTFTRSRAGLGLTIAALLGAAALAISRKQAPQWRLSPGRVVVGASLLGSLMALQLALYRVLERFEADPLSDARIPFARNTIEAALAHMPFGTGLGTFVPVYGLFEKPADTLFDTFANRAHNDLLEVWLEAGFAAIALFSAFAVWYLLSTIRVWRRARTEIASLDTGLARAASLAILLLLLHSTVDYPLRTTALLCLFALCCGLLLPSTWVEHAPAGVRASRDQQTPRPRNGEPPAGRRAFSVEWHDPQPGPESLAQPRPRPRASSDPLPPGSAWGGEIEWPEAWKRRDSKES